MYSIFLKHVILPLGDFLFGGIYLKSLKQWNYFDTLSEKELLKIQEQELQRTLQYAIHHVPFYKNFEYDASLSPAKNLKNLPILTKEILRNPTYELVSDEFDKHTLHKNFSSGSSGIQSFSYSTKKNVFYLQGLNYHWYAWGGFEIGNKLLQFGISPKRTLAKKLKDIFFRVQYEEAFSLDETDYSRIFKDLKRKKIRFILGYPSAINQLAEYIIKNDFCHHLHAIISLGDKLFPHFEENFKKAFNNPNVIDTYGCAEGIMLACRDDLPFYYISAPHVYIEIVDDEGNDVKAGKLGHVLATCFTNDAQPFIRYKLGDLAIKLAKENYPKHRKFNYPLLEKIVGRETDIVKTPNGKTLIVHSFTGIIEYYPDIKHYQIIQKTEDEIILNYIVDDLIPLQENTLEEIRIKINQLTESSLKITFEKTDHIPNSPSGKPQIIKSLIP